MYALIGRGAGRGDAWGERWVAGTQGPWTRGATPLARRGEPGPGRPSPPPREPRGGGRGLIFSDPRGGRWGWRGVVVTLSSARVPRLQPPSSSGSTLRASGTHRADQ